MHTPLVAGAIAWGRTQGRVDGLEMRPWAWNLRPAGLLGEKRWWVDWDGRVVPGERLIEKRALLVIARRYWRTVMRRGRLAFLTSPRVDLDIRLGMLVWATAPPVEGRLDGAGMGGGQ